MSKIIESHHDSGSVDPLAQKVFDELRKSGTRTWLGAPPPEEIERFRQEMAKRDLQAIKSRAEAKDRHMDELKQRARAAMQRGRDGLV